MALTSKLAAIAEAIRAKTGNSDKLTLDQMASEIANIQTGSSDIPFSFGGMNAGLVATYDEQFTLADTSFVVGSTSSTSATSIKAAVSNRFTSPTLAIGDKDVVVVQTATCEPEYGSNAVDKARLVAYCITYVTYIAKRRSSTTNAATQGTRTAVSCSAPWLRYYNASGTETYTSASYGLYITPSAASVASSTAASTTVRASSPVLYARASSSYASVDNQKAITNATWNWHVDVYLVDPKSSVGNAIHNNSLNVLFPPTMNLGLDDDDDEAEGGEK